MPPRINLPEIASGLTLSPEGLWTSVSHVDLGFLEDDATDWAAIEQESFWYQHRNRCFLEVLRQHPPSGTFFEIGAGNGTVAMALQEAGIPVVAIEPTVKSARHARRRGLTHVVCATLEGAKFQPGSLTSVGMFDVLEHLPEDAAFLQNVRALMPRGGRLYCAVPAYNWLWSTEDDTAGHVRRYRLIELRERIRRAGFTVDYATCYFVVLTLPILVLRAIPSRLGVRPARTHQSSQREHRLPENWAGRLVGRALEWELGVIARSGRHAFGASCLVVATAA